MHYAVAWCVKKSLKIMTSIVNDGSDDDDDDDDYDDDDEMIRLIDKVISMFQVWTSHSPVARYETCITSNRTSRVDRIETRLIFGKHVGVINNFLSEVKQVISISIHIPSFFFLRQSSLQL